jgi:hypothetical protein
VVDLWAKARRSAGLRLHSNCPHLALPGEVASGRWALEYEKGYEEGMGHLAKPDPNLDSKLDAVGHIAYDLLESLTIDISNEAYSSWLYLLPSLRWELTRCADDVLASCKASIPATSVSLSLMWLLN